MAKYRSPLIQITMDDLQACLERLPKSEQQLVREAAQTVADWLPDNVKAGPVTCLEIVAAVGRVLCTCEDQQLTSVPEL